MVFGVVRFHPHPLTKQKENKMRLFEKLLFIAIMSVYVTALIIGVSILVVMLLG
jgi:uncharacterized membrane protein YqjE